MQEPIRYYITKSGEEPTVRSVKVAQSSPECDDQFAGSAGETEHRRSPTRPTPAPVRTVERLVNRATRGRPSEA